MVKALCQFDFGFICALLLIAASTLLSFRGAALTENRFLLLAVFFFECGLVYVWHSKYRRRTAPDKLPEIQRNKTTYGIGHDLFLSSLLFLFTLVGFFIPLRKSFWHGFDDPMTLTQGALFGFSYYDTFICRPLNFVQANIANLISPNSIDGYLVLAICFHFLSSLLLYSLLRNAIPGLSPVPIVASILLAVNPSEPMRYMMVTMSGYYFAPFLLWLSIWLYFSSFKRESRILLALSCFLLGGSIASHEAAIPLAMVVPLLLWLSDRTRSHFGCWAYAWLGTVSILAIRFAIFLRLNPAAYQYHPGGGGKIPSSLDELFTNVLVHLKPTLSYFSLHGVGDYWAYGIGLSVIALLLLLLERHRSAPSLNRRFVVLGLSLSLLGILLGIGPYINFRIIERSQFYAEPAQAIFYAFLILFAASFVPAAFRHASVTALTLLLVFSAGVSSMAHQDAFVPNIRFEKIVYIFDQVRRIAPQFRPDTLLLFVLEDKDVTPLGHNYSVECLSDLAFGVNAIQTNYADPFGYNPIFSSKGVDIGKSAGAALISFEKTPVHYSYKQVVAFAVSPYGDVRLLRSIPGYVLPDDSWAREYYPISQIGRGSGLEPFLKYTRLSNWMLPYHRETEGVPNEIKPILGRGWYQPEEWAGEKFRWVSNDAEIWLPPSESGKELELELELEPGPAIGNKDHSIKITDEKGNNLAIVPMSARCSIRINMPNGEQVQPIKLHVDSENLVAPNDSRILNFRVFGLHVHAI